MKKILPILMAVLCTLALKAQPTTVGLVAYWKMDGNFTDAGPYGINGSNGGATATTNIGAQANKAMLFLNPSLTSTTVAQYATHPVNANVNFSGAQDFTIAFYTFINSPYVHTGGFYDNNMNYSGPGIWFWNAPGTPTVQFNYKNSSIGTVAGTLPLGQWVHITAIRAAGTLKLYINGMLNKSGPEGNTAPSYTYPARFGTMFYQPYPHYNGLNGKLDEFRIYNRALTALEIIKVLPVQLASFTAVKNNNKIKLQWQTQNEQNSKHFVIQRSTDGVNYTDNDQVNAAGNSPVPLTYNYIDVLPVTLQSKASIFYRLQSVDLDGRFFNSDVVVVHPDKTDIQLLLSPNPAKDVLQVQTGNSLAGKSVLLITDAMGREIYKKDLVMHTGANTIPVNVSLFGSGIYSVRLINGDKTLVKQFVKE